MQGYRKIMVILGLVLLLSLSAAGIASADVLYGKGWLHAEGAGYAKLQMTGQVDINGHGVGAVYLYGAESIHAEGSGRRTNLAGGGVVFRGYNGTIEASGEQMVVKIIGGKIDFTAEGKGYALLRGRGWYETGNGSTGSWSPAGLTVKMGQE